MCVRTLRQTLRVAHTMASISVFLFVPANVGLHFTFSASTIPYKQYCTPGTVGMRLLRASLLSNLAIAHAPIPKQPQIQYANHIFNAVHSSMRQFGSSLNHNGVCLFVATVPEGTEFYHGTSSPYRVNKTEWLAFEPEHALLFARGRRPSPPGREIGPRPGGTSPPGNKGKNQEGLASIAEQKPISGNEFANDRGYLHTYRTKHALRLLYLDGQSAAKSDKGTLDAQDLVLLHHNPPSDNQMNPAYQPPLLRRVPRGSTAQSYSHKTDDTNDPEHHGPMGESERALGMCELARKEWHGKIDGMMRMEGGFEIILCDFKKDLDVVRITQAKSDDGGNGPPERRDSGDLFDYYKAIAARYDGIGGGRVTVDYEDFVTLLSFPDVVYFDETGRPRVDNSSAEGIAAARSAIRDMVFRNHDHDPINWQEIVDMVISRYSDRIDVLATSSAFDTLADFTGEVNRALRPFINYNDRNASTEAQHCASQFLPAHAQLSPTYQTISNVTTVLCRTLVAASRADTLSRGVSLVRGLKSWLAWTTWKRCRGCAADEVCFLPIWPMGAEADFEQPQCVDENGFSSRDGGYWRGKRRPYKLLGHVDEGY